jgi:hypothetical protein
MSITKQITNDNGVIYEYHKVVSVSIDKQDNLHARVCSYLNADRATDADRPVNCFSTQIYTTITTGLVATAEGLLVADPTCKLFGGTVTPDVILSDLDAAKAKKKAEIAAARSVAMYADKTTSLGVFGSTESDNNKLSIAIQVTQIAAALGNPAECGYKTVDGTYSVYTLAQLEQIALEIAAQVLPLYERESTLVAQVDAATTVEEVESIHFGVLP